VVGRDEALHALRRELIGREFAAASVLAVNDVAPVGFVLRVRAGRRIHPHTVVLAADERSLTHDHAWDEPLANDDAEQWAYRVALWLEEQFGSRVLDWGPRVVLADGTSAVDLRAEPEVMPSWPGDVSEVSLDRPTPAGHRRLRRLALRKGLGLHRRAIVVMGDGFGSEPDPAPGGHLAEAGLDVRPGRAAVAEGRLISWLQLFAHDRGGAPPVGHLVVAWRDEVDAVAELEHLEYRPQAPHGAVEHLVLVAIHGAADAGARSIEHRLDDVAHLGPVLPWQAGNGVARLDAADIP
jgi:hypothetical protein